MTIRRVIAVAMLAAGLLTACSPRTTDDVVGSASSAEVDIGLVDFEILTSPPVLQDGAVAFDVTNAGATAHDLRIDGEKSATAILPPGGTAILDLDTAGRESVTLYCSLPGHREQGMELTMEVRR